MGDAAATIPAAAPSPLCLRPETSRGTRATLHERVPCLPPLPCAEATAGNNPQLFAVKLPVSLSASLTVCNGGEAARLAVRCVAAWPRATALRFPRCIRLKLHCCGDVVMQRLCDSLSDEEPRLRVLDLAGSSDGEIIKKKRFILEWRPSFLVASSPFVSGFCSYSGVDTWRSLEV